MTCVVPDETPAQDCAGPEEGGSSTEEGEGEDDHEAGQGEAGEASQAEGG